MVSSLENLDEHSVSREQNRAEELYKRGLLFTVTCTGTTFKTGNSAADFGMDSSKIPSGMYLGNQLWMPKEVVNERDRIYGVVRRKLERMSLTFPLPGIRFVPYGNVYNVMTMVAESKEELNKWKEDYRKNEEKYFEEVLDEIRNKYTKPEDHKLRDAYITKLRHAHIPADQVLGGCHIIESTTRMSVPSATEEVDTIQAIMLDDAKLSANREAQIWAKQQIESTIKQTHERLQGFEESAKNEIKAAFIKDFSVISDRVTNGGRLSMKSVNSLRRAIERFRSLNVVGLDSIGTMLDSVEAQLPGTAQELASDDNHQTMETLMKNTIDEISSSMTPAGRRRFSL